MEILQALFFPPEQPGGVSSMVPYMQERFTKVGWPTELFSLPKRVRGKGHEDVVFHALRLEDYGDNPTIQKYMPDAAGLFVVDEASDQALL